jgi:hypothetical protein
MSIMASLDSLSKEYFDVSYDCLTMYQQQVIIELYRLEDTPKCLTDLLIK